TDKPVVGQIIEFLTIRTHITIQADDFVAVELEVDTRTPGKVFAADIGAVQANFKAFVSHLTQVIIHPVKAQNIRQAPLHQQVSGGHVVSFDGTINHVIKQCKVHTEIK